MEAALAVLMNTALGGASGGDGVGWEWCGGWELMRSGLRKFAGSHILIPLCSRLGQRGAAPTTLPCRC